MTQTVLVRLSQLLLVSTVVVCALDAQQRAPKRPRLPAGADSSDPIANYRYALAAMNSDARAADAALYWALKRQRASEGSAVTLRRMLDTLTGYIRVATFDNAKTAEA